MVVAEPLYGFYNTEINLHFLHALVSRDVLKDMVGFLRLGRCSPVNVDFLEEMLLKNANGM